MRNTFIWFLPPVYFVIYLLFTPKTSTLQNIWILYLYTRHITIQRAIVFIFQYEYYLNLCWISKIHCLLHHKWHEPIIKTLLAATYPQYATQEKKISNKQSLLFSDCICMFLYPWHQRLISEIFSKIVCT